MARVWGVLLYLHNRLGEPSTWRGLVSLGMAMGLVMEPTQIEAIIITGLAIHGLVATFVPDDPTGKR